MLQRVDTKFFSEGIILRCRKAKRGSWTLFLTRSLKSRNSESWHNFLFWSYFCETSKQSPHLKNQKRLQIQKSSWHSELQLRIIFNTVVLVLTCVEDTVCLSAHLHCEIKSSFFLFFFPCVLFTFTLDLQEVFDIAQSTYY